MSGLLGTVALIGLGFGGAAAVRHVMDQDRIAVQRAKAEAEQVAGIRR